MELALSLFLLQLSLLVPVFIQMELVSLALLVSLLQPFSFLQFFPLQALLTLSFLELMEPTKLKDPGVQAFILPLRWVRQASNFS